MSSAGSSLSARPRVNLRSTAVKRIMQEASELSDPDTDDFVAGPLETDIFEWHCTMRGVPGSEYDGGLYHIRIVLPASYPMSAPDIMLMTPNGRFELGKKICIDGLTSFHAGSWQPAWGVRTAITGLRSFWMQGGEALSAVGALDCPREERQRLAKLSCDWVCPTCKVQNSELLDVKPSSNTATLNQLVPSVKASHETEDTNKEQPESESGKTSANSIDNSLQLTEVAPLKRSLSSADHPTAPSAPSSSSQPTPTRVSEPQSAPGPSAGPTTVQATPLATRPVSQPPISRPPLWIDASIFVLVSILAILIARRLA